MLYKRSDAATVRTWLSRAFELGAKDGKSPAELARLCGVSPQAVSGWKRTGRITKSNLEKAVEYFGYGPSFTHGNALVAREPEPGSAGAWPFKKVPYERFARLPSAERQRIERQVAFMVSECEAQKPAKRKR